MRNMSMRKTGARHGFPSPAEEGWNLIHFRKYFIVVTLQNAHRLQ